MNIGLIDVDAESRGKVTFPNLPLMKLSAWHKAHGDNVQWYSPLVSGHMDRVYMARVFNDEYTHDYLYPIDADEVFRGVQDMQSIWKTGRNDTAKQKTVRFRKRLNIFILIMICTASQILHTDSLQGAVRADVISAMWQTCKDGSSENMHRYQSSGRIRRTLSC